MSISDKTRKILWGRSGSRCSICKLELIIDETEKDDSSIVGEECHIISGQRNGPRHDPNRPKDEIDTYENLILLCRIHHKMIDDQPETFTENIIKQIKVNHELWVSARLNQQDSKQLRIKRIRENIPETLPRITTEKEVINILDRAMGYEFDHDEPNNEAEVELISGFLQYLHDFGDLLSDFGSGEKVRFGFEITRMIKELLDNDYYVFGAREARVLEGGKAAPSSFPIAIVYVKHKNNILVQSADKSDLE
ncbi:HNH endonuclease [Paenibacillus thiaminolyticus]|uniref:HNH endonuclease n=1 Tax=Paenibacillus thiaminolyticus TaxID=49283 RepID=UPI00232CDD2F|nr:HNH endonuclease [Paenibacillus thiaminolyticus]WCF08320.1 HNH endonuclease [Paenibacillus thiaminolyticus]